MSAYANETHDPARTSWVASANDGTTDFPIQNLPLGVFRRAGTDERRRIGVAIGNQIVDVHALVEAHLVDDLGPEGCCALSAETLNDYFARGRDTWSATRAALGSLLDAGDARLRDDETLRARAMVSQADTEMFVPATIGDYTDFYASKYHATNVGSMFRPDNPLMPNYTHLPVGYHGRASSIVVSGTPVRRPMGQTKAGDAAVPVFGPCRLLDYEMEMGFFCGAGNALGTRIPMGDAGEHVAGMCIVNDWSARDVQKWEYQPLGPFNAKNFATTISPWVVSMEALAPFRVSGPLRDADDPEMLDYLQPVDDFGVDMVVEVWLASSAMRDQGMEPVLISRGNFKDMFWTMAQMLVHHSSTGCNIQPGDLMASGTISGPEENARGCLLERTWRGQHPIGLPDGTERKFLQDGDEVLLRAFCQTEGAVRIGFGECRGIVTPAE